MRRMSAAIQFAGAPNPEKRPWTILHGRERTLHLRYAALASHYTFRPKFCLPATATEKPRVENRVFDLQP